MTPTLPPLTLDDIRAAGPDRDNAEAFDAHETWCLACDKLGAGYSASTIAAVLLTLDPPELDAVAADWIDHTLTTLDQPALNGRDFNCPDLRLCLALQAADPDREAWGCAPTLDPETLWEAVELAGRREAALEGLRHDLSVAENVEPALRLLLREARAHNDALNSEDQPNGPQCPTGDDYNALLDMIEAAGASAFGKGEG